MGEEERGSSNDDGLDVASDPGESEVGDEIKDDWALSAVSEDLGWVDSYRVFGRKGGGRLLIADARSFDVSGQNRTRRSQDAGHRSGNILGQGTCPPGLLAWGIRQAKRELAYCEFVVCAGPLVPIFEALGGSDGNEQLVVQQDAC